MDLNLRRITLPYEMAKTLNKQLTCALEETSNDASALPIPDVIKSVCECNTPKFNQYVDFCLNCGLPSKE